MSLLHATHTLATASAQAQMRTRDDPNLHLALVRPADPCARAFTTEDYDE